MLGCLAPQQSLSMGFVLVMGFLIPAHILKIFSFLYSLLFWYLGYKLQVSNPWELKRSGWLGSRLAIKFTQDPLSNTVSIQFLMRKSLGGCTTGRKILNNHFLERLARKFLG